MHNNYQSMLQQNRYLSFNESKCQWLLFVTLGITLFVKIMMFHWQTFHSIMFSSLWKNPINFWLFWLPKFSISVFIASFVFLGKNKWWTAVFLLFIDVWITANYIYFRANGLFLSVSMILIASNLNGFTSSILMYVDRYVAVNFLVTLIFIVIVKFFVTSCRRNFKLFSLFLVISIFTSTIVNILEIKKYNESLWHIFPFDVSTKSILYDFDREYALISNHSIVSYLPTSIVYHYKSEYIKKHYISELTDEEKRKIKKCVNNVSLSQSPSHNLILILVESFESWPLEYDVIMPNFNQFISESQNILFANNIKSQVRHGVSGDGQMILNTGLLPINTGVACLLYGNNSFPNIASSYKKSIVINPSKGTWNQGIVTYSYGYKNLIEPDKLSWGDDWWSDEVIFTQLYENVLKQESLYCIQAITISSHSPFDRVKNSNIIHEDICPSIIKNYLNCLHYTDSCFGVFIEKMRINNLLDNTTIVITGDHTVFREDVLKTFQTFAEENDLSVQNGKNYVPLIIYSPDIQESIHIDEECYQMDIFPTIMHLIGCEDYYWKGFGVNLLDSAARHNRTCSEEDAYMLSDKLIRSNWFSTFDFNK